MEMKDIKHAKTFAGLPKNCIIGDFGIAWEDGKVYRCIERGKWTEFGGDTTQTQYCVTIHVDSKSSEEWVDVTSPASTISAPDDPSKEGYEFVEWNTKADGTGNTITFPYSVESDVDIYAIFSEYEAIYDDDVKIEEVGELLGLEDNDPVTSEGGFASGDFVSATLGDLTIVTEATAGTVEYEGEDVPYVGNLHLIGNDYEDTGEKYLFAMLGENSLYAMFSPDIEGISAYIDQTVTLTVEVAEV